MAKMMDMDIEDGNINTEHAQKIAQETDMAGRTVWLRKRDIILCIVLIAVGITCWLVMWFVLPAGNTADVYIDGKMVQTIDMTVDDVYEFSTDRGSNTVVVESGKIRVSDADCPDKVCVDMGWKSRRGETITCLPHKLVIEIQGGGERDIDVQ